MDNEIAGSRILLVEDEETLAGGLEYNLSAEGTWLHGQKTAGKQSGYLILKNLI
ncbi:MAG TPA: hypothetical protein VKD08_08750 [Ignavibacteriaceae bacterium]|nr:hypothetical protein [Ignavibacteriaceae bacterium]